MVNVGRGGADRVTLAAAGEAMGVFVVGAIVACVVAMLTVSGSVVGFTVRIVAVVPGSGGVTSAAGMGSGGVESVGEVAVVVVGCGAVAAAGRVVLVSAGGTAGETAVAVGEVAVGWVTRMSTMDVALVRVQSSAVKTCGQVDAGALVGVADNACPAFDSDWVAVCVVSDAADATWGGSLPGNNCVGGLPVNNGLPAFAILSGFNRCNGIGSVVRISSGGAGGSVYSPSCGARPAAPIVCAMR